MAAVKPDVKPDHESMDVVIAGDNQLERCINYEVLLGGLVDVQGQQSGGSGVEAVLANNVHQWLLQGKLLDG